MPAAPGQTPALPSRSSLASSRSAIRSATQHRPTEHNVPARSSGVWDQEWVMGALLSDRRQTGSLPAEGTPQNRSLIPGTSHPRTGLTTLFPRNAQWNGPSGPRGKLNHTDVQEHQSLGWSHSSPLFVGFPRVLCRGLVQEMGQGPKEKLQRTRELLVGL